MFNWLVVEGDGCISSNSYIFSFEKLDVWQISRKLTLEIYKITNSFPDEEKYGLTNQLRRASVSIVSNLAEGSGRTNKNDKARFTQIAYGSLTEVLCQLIIAKDLKYITNYKLDELRITIEEISNKLNALRRSQLNR